MSWLVVVIAIAGCGVTTDEGAEELAPDPEIELDVAPEAAAAAFAVDATGDSALLAACHGTSSNCGTVISCHDWSNAFNCGTPTCSGIFCGPPCPSSNPFCDRPRKIAQPREQFRECAQLTGGTCREYRPVLASFTCGCGVDPPES